MEKITLTRGQETLIDNADYDWLSTWKWHASKRSDGTFVAARGRRRIEPEGPHLILMHRVITNAPTDMCVDHINGDSLDNRRANLRLCTHGQNMKNSHKRRTYNGRRTSSQYKGVSWFKPARIWRADIRVDGRPISLGYFHDEREAALAYNEAASRYFGEFANLNSV